MGRKILKKPEVLAPAGTLEKLKTAILYGADAVFLGGEAYGLRSRAGTFDFAERKKPLILPMHIMQKYISQQTW